VRAQPSVLIGPSPGHGFHHHQPVVGDTPSQILQAYGFNQLNISEPGLGQTIAIVDAYELPNIQSDLATFDAKYNLPAINLNVINDGATSQDPTGGWDLEAALDVEWAHSIAPYANIVLVEAADDSVNSAGVPTNLLHAVSVAASQPNVTVVSMSWGVPEFASETQYDSYFGAPGVTFVAASGDNGAGTIWPAVSPNVLAVGGTTLEISSSGDYGGETGWGNGFRSASSGGSGGGISQYEKAPAYQQGNYLSSVADANGMRMSPDVAYDADPNTGVAVYDSTNGGWQVIGGTSAGTPQWAALVALADQMRAAVNESSLSTVQTLTALYQEQGDFHDITSGNSGYSAGVGYDLVTGLGSPEANLLVSALANQASIPESPSSSAPTGSSDFVVTGTQLQATSGQAFTGTVATITTSAFGATTDSFTATIDWGDGTTSNGTIGIDANGGFDVTGTHTYNLTGSSSNQIFHINVVVTETASGDSLTASSAAAVVTASSGQQESANQLYITQLYHTLLGRSPDAGGLAYFTSELNQGVSRTEIVMQVEESQEYLTDEVDSIYQKMLNRPADPSGLATFTNMLANGASEEQVESIIAGSQEYYQTRGGSQIGGFLSALYSDALNRAVDPTGEAAFTQALAAGVSRQAVATAIFGSAEYRQDLVESYYETYLGRQADNGGLTTFTTMLAQGGSNQAVVAAILGSQEYFQNF